MTRDPYSTSEQALRSFLREQRNIANLRKSDLACRLGVPQSFVSKYESGERLLTFLEVLEIIRELGVSIEDLMKSLPSPVYETQS